MSEDFERTPNAEEPVRMKKQPTSLMCFVCGESNPAGVHVRFYEQEDSSILARFTGSELHQGYPGRMHGGVITAIMDETMGRTIKIEHDNRTWGVTVELNVRFRKPVPLEAELTARGRMVQETRRVVECSGELHLPDGTVAVEATGKFVKLDIGELGSLDPEEAGWYVRPD